MSDSIGQPLLLNDSIKDSIEDPTQTRPPPYLQQQSQPQPVREQSIEISQPEKPKVEAQTEVRKQPTVTTATVNNPSNISDQPQPSRIVQQSILSVQDVSTTKLKGMGKRRYKVLLGCSIVCFLIGFVFVFALPPFIQNMIKEQAIDQVIMKKQNEGMWAHFPGDTDTIITRNFTFFQLLNQDDFLIRHQKPQFQEVSGFKIQELEDFLDITYLEDGNKVKVRDWTRFVDWSESRDLDSKVRILNLGNLGYWTTLKNARPTLILQQGLALLFTNLQASIVSTLLGTGISSQFLPDKSTAINSLMVGAGIESSKWDWLWDDGIYGLGNADHLGIWAQAANDSCFQKQQCGYSSFANDIQSYFVFTDLQTRRLMESFYGYVTNLQRILLENHYCADIDMSLCTGRYLAVAQFAQGWVTAFPPPVSTISPNDTICLANSTCAGFYPEIYAYEKNAFPNRPGPRPNAEITFTREQVLGWFNYNHSVSEGDKWNKAENCLLHIGNLDQIWQWGSNYDKGWDEDGLKKITNRLKLTNTTQADVVWDWLKYMAFKFVRQEQQIDRLGVANLFTQGLQKNFDYTLHNLQPFLLTKMVQAQLQKQQCHLFFQNTLEQGEQSQLVKNLCNFYLNDIHSQQFAGKMVATCQAKEGPAWQQLRARGVSLLALEYHCENNGKNNIGSMIHNIKLQLDQKYQCDSTPSPYCSDFQLAAKQWANSTVTSDPPTSVGDMIKPSQTFNTWKKQVSAFEFGYFKSKLDAADRQTFPEFNVSELMTLMSFDQWFSAPVVLRSFKSDVFNPHMIRYLRWLTISVSLRGFTTSRTARQILFGYQDEFLKEIKESPPPFGGDPSAPALIALNDPNITSQEANMTIVFKTGKDDFRDVYQNYQINGEKYLINEYFFFNGNQTISQWRSPWKENDYFYGTTAKIFAPNQFEADNLSLLIPQVQRYGSNFFHNQTEKTQRYGMELYMAFLSPYIGEVAPHNDKYYQTLENVFNVTSIYGLPLFITKNHFMNCTQWFDRVDIFNEQKSIQYKQVSHWDDTFVIIEPYTGVSFQSKIYLQNNYYHQPDFLYTHPLDTMLPIFAIARSGNLSEAKFHELYDPLVMALDAKPVVVRIGIGMIVCFALLGFLGFYLQRKAQRAAESQVRKDELTGISLQQQHIADSLIVEEPTQRLIRQRDDES